MKRDEAASRSASARHGAGELSNGKPATSQAVIERCLSMLPRGGPTELRPREPPAGDRTGHVPRQARCGRAYRAAAGRCWRSYPTDEPAANRRVGPLAHVPASRRRRRQVRRRSWAKAVADGGEAPHRAHAARLTWLVERRAKLELLKFYEQARTVKGGYSVDKYVEHFTRDYLKNLVDARAATSDCRRRQVAGVGPFDARQACRRTPAPSRWRRFAISTAASRPKCARAISIAGCASA